MQVFREYLKNIAMKTKSPFINALHHAASQGVPSLFQIDGCGSVSVYPRQHCYVTDIQDWEAAYHSPSGQITIESVAWSMPPADALPLMELQWRVAYHDALRNQQPGVGGNDLIRLRSWPNLTRLPSELVAPVTQICALLWRKPAVGFLIPRVLDADVTRICALLDVLQAFGHLRVSIPVSGSQPVVSAETEDSGHDAWNTRNVNVTPFAGTLVGKLWRRLIGH